jgi:uncharacterized protein DUF2652
MGGRVPFTGNEMRSGVRSGPARGTLLLADITGYTAFLQSVAKAHAEDMAAGTFVPEAYPLLTSLLDGIVERITPAFTVSKIEGDAVFAFAGEQDLSLRGPSLLGALTDCYLAYRARLDAARELMPCSCWACSMIGDLELKFVVHHGEYVVQPIAGHDELLGPNVTVAHLLLKNHVESVIGRSAYALFTESAVDRLEVPRDRCVPVTERYEYYAPIRAQVLPLAEPAI